MPNWCENHLSIAGKDVDMQKLLEVITIGEGEYSLLEKLYPTPEELCIGDSSVGGQTPLMISNMEKYGFKSWYDWNIENWGTKWSESDLSIGQSYTLSNDFGVIAFNFETAWAPPLEAFDKISKDYPNLLFAIYYEEPGMAFCGKKVWALGEPKEEYQAELVSKWFDEEYMYDEYYKTHSS